MYHSSSLGLNNFVANDRKSAMMKSPTLPILEDSLYNRLNFPSILMYNFFAARLMNTLTSRALYICLYFVSILLLLLS